MKRLLSSLFVLCILFPAGISAQQQIYKVSAGTVRFHSEAQEELIRSESEKLMGVIDVNKRTFYFKISMISFEGFNSPLQKEHFNENYMESDIFPFATYSGKIIEDIDLSKDGDYNVRSKGKLSIHGVDHTCIIRCHIINKNSVISVQSDFVVLLADYNIKIPRIVYDKLSPEIKVSVNAVLVPKLPL